MLLLKKSDKAVIVNGKNQDKFLGVRRYDFGVAEKDNQVGQVVGLAWTEVGRGDLLARSSSASPTSGASSRPAISSPPSSRASLMRSTWATAPGPCSPHCSRSHCSSSPAPGSSTASQAPGLQPIKMPMSTSKTVRLSSR